MHAGSVDQQHLEVCLRLVGQHAHLSNYSFEA